MMVGSENVGLFGTRTRSSVLLAVHMLGETYPTQVARVLGVSLNQAQKAICSLERAGVVVGEVEGRQRRVRLNPRYALATELAALLDGMATYDVPLQRRIAEARRRPRLAGKDL